eukprot:217447-Pyramimonas_sp.AAC.2
MSARTHAACSAGATAGAGAAGRLPHGGNAEPCADGRQRAGPSAPGPPPHPRLRPARLRGRADGAGCVGWSAALSTPPLWRALLPNAGDHLPFIISTCSTGAKRVGCTNPRV